MKHECSYRKKTIDLLLVEWKNDDGCIINTNDAIIFFCPFCGEKLE